MSDLQSWNAKLPTSSESRLHTTCLKPFLKENGVVKALGNAEVQEAMLVSCCLIIDNGLQAVFLLLAVLFSN